MWKTVCLHETGGNLEGGWLLEVEAGAPGSAVHTLRSDLGHIVLHILGFCMQG